GTAGAARPERCVPVRVADRRGLWCSSKTLQIGERLRVAVNVHGAEFRAAIESGNVLAWIEQRGRVEGRLHGMKTGDLVTVELAAHLVDLLPADAVLAGNAATDGNTQLQDGAA